ncbi:class I SAM-dependent methyltransferase [Bacillus sp. FJAT-27231]|uniref:class I SAM-dependent methyltransferase n=1 Tax=Bacillus sp. FJAT-27231 TaxID=1679168 RepID=UPI000A46792E|nr:class I SAM-dependent methyltransferase [Bacillus sp. FJAT-27231]
MVLIKKSIYLDFLSKFGIGGAHPGGINLTKEIIKAEKIDKTSYVLDVGCGTGQTAAYLARQYGAKVMGVDINPIMIEKAKNRMKESNLPVEIVQGSIEDFPLPDGTFDFIISESVLAFVNKPKSLKEIYRLLKNNGRFLANELTLNKRLGSPHAEEIMQFYGFESLLTEADWITLFERTGFKNRKIHPVNPSIFQNISPPEFQYSEYIEPQLYSVSEKHVYMTAKYEGILDFRVFSCTK